MNLLVSNVSLAVHSITKDTPLFAPERLAEAGKMILLGMGAVFAVLALLWGVLGIFKIFAYDLPRKHKENAKKEAVSTETPAAVEPAVVAPVEEEYEAADEGELIAVIAAAVAAYRAAESGGAEVPGGFRVVSFRRAVKGSSWNSK